MGAEANLLSGGRAVPGGPASGRGPFGRYTCQGLHWMIVFGVIVLSACGTAALSSPIDRDWVGIIFATLGLWALWLCWRTAEGDRHVPAHLLHPFLALPMLILLMHLVRGAAVDDANGRVDVVVLGDTSVLVRLMTLGLGVLLVQDVLSRLRHLRWVLSAVGFLAAAGAILRLSLAPTTAGGEAIALAGLAGVGMLLTPLAVPRFFARPHPALERPWVEQAETTVRISLSALLAVALIVLCPSAGALAAGAVAASMILSGAMLGRRRAALLAAGAILGCGSVAAMWRLGWGAGPWAGVGGWAALVGRGIEHESAGGAVVSGLEMLVGACGWVGAISVAGGMVAALAWSLRASRAAAAGDQARAALWAATALLAGAALMAEGGLSIPSVIAAASVTFGLTPHIMTHRVRRFRGWAVGLAFAAMLVVLGMEQQLGGRMWSNLTHRWGDETMHAFFALVLTVVLFWQTRSHRWWHALLCTLAGAMATAAGEIAQEYFTTARAPEWSDVAADGAGAALALLAFVVVRGTGWIETVWTQRPTKVSFDKYRLWQPS